MAPVISFHRPENITKGERVGSILHYIRIDGVKWIHLLGYGTYNGDKVPPKKVKSYAAEIHRNRGTKIPNIKLDNGDIIYECECFWGKEADIRKEIEEQEKHDFRVKEVRISQWRQIQ